jgi:hypothetical protein
MAKFTLYKYVKLETGKWQYKKAAFHPNGKIKPNVVMIDGVEEKHAEGAHFVNFDNRWIPVGEDALDAQRERAVIVRRY